MHQNGGATSWNDDLESSDLDTLDVVSFQKTSRQLPESGEVNHLWVKTNMTNWKNSPCSKGKYVFLHAW